MKLARFFALEAHVPVMGTTGTARVNQYHLLLGIIAGAVLRPVYDALKSGNDIAWRSAGAGAIASIILFPILYYGSGLDRRKANLATWCLAIQNGFFWETALGELMKSRS